MLLENKQTKISLVLPQSKPFQSGFSLHTLPRLKKMRLPKITFRLPNSRSTQCSFSQSPCDTTEANFGRILKGPRLCQAMSWSRISTPRDTVITRTWKQPHLFFLSQVSRSPFPPPPSPSPKSFY